MGAYWGSTMALRYDIGEKFPSVSLIDDRERETSIAELASDQPLFLAFYRGPW